MVRRPCGWLRSVVWPLRARGRVRTRCGSWRGTHDQWGSRGDPDRTFDSAAEIGQHLSDEFAQVVGRFFEVRARPLMLHLRDEYGPEVARQFLTMLADSLRSCADQLEPPTH
jgi:hypothetical protein